MAWSGGKSERLPRMAWLFREGACVACQKMRDQTGSDRGGHVMSHREIPIDEEVEFAHPQFASGAGQFRGERIGACAAVATRVVGPIEMDGRSVRLQNPHD